MDWSSWFRRALLKDPHAPQISDSSPRKKQKKIEEDLEQYGVTQPLIDLIKTFTSDTFKDFHCRGAPIAISALYRCVVYFIEMRY